MLSFPVAIRAAHTFLFSFFIAYNLLRTALHVVATLTAADTQVIRSHSLQQFHPVDALTISSRSAALASPVLVLV